MHAVVFACGFLETSLTPIRGLGKMAPVARADGSNTAFPALPDRQLIREVDMSQVTASCSVCGKAFEVRFS